MKDDKLYLIHISECIERIETYVSESAVKVKSRFGPKNEL